MLWVLSPLSRLFVSGVFVQAEEVGMDFCSFGWQPYFSSTSPLLIFAELRSRLCKLPCLTISLSPSPPCPTRSCSLSQQTLGLSLPVPHVKLKLKLLRFSCQRFGFLPIRTTVLQYFLDPNPQRGGDPLRTYEPHILVSLLERSCWESAAGALGSLLL